MVDTATISAVIVAVGVIIGLVFTLLELRHMAEARRMEVIMSVYKGFGTREMIEAINSVGRLKQQGMHSPPPQEVLVSAMQVAVSMEGLGVLLDEGLIDIGLLNNLFGPTLDYLWEPLSTIIEGMRKSLGEPFFFVHLEKLHARLVEYRKTRQ